MGELERLTLTYWTITQRIRRPPMSEAARARMLADVGVIYRRERAGLRAPDQCNSTSIG